MHPSQMLAAPMDGLSLFITNRRKKAIYKSRAKRKRDRKDIEKKKEKEINTCTHRD